MLLMPYISFLVFLFVCLYPSEYRRTALILMLSFIINLLLIPFYDTLASTSNYTVHILYGGIDAITAFCMLRWGSKYKIAQALILIAAVFFNAITMGVYGSGWVPEPFYQTTIFLMNLGQIFLIWGGIYGLFRTLYQNFMQFYARRLRAGLNYNRNSDVGKG